MKITTSPILIGLVASALLGNSCARPDANAIQSLEYDKIHPFKVGEHAVSIETQSFSITTGDNGPAKLIVSTNGTDTSLSSHFNNDLWLDIRPGYISWQDVDQDRLRDLVIWKPGLNELVALEYISSKDGKLYNLALPLQQPLPEPPGFW